MELKIEIGSNDFRKTFGFSEERWDELTEHMKKESLRIIDRIMANKETSIDPVEFAIAFCSIAETPEEVAFLSLKAGGVPYELNDALLCTLLPKMFPPEEA